MPALNLTAPETQQLLSAFYNEYALVLDRRENAKWIEYFTGDGVYSITTFENANSGGLYLICDRGGAAIRRRAAVAAGYLQAQRNKTLHMISNIRVGEVSGSSISATAYFAMFRTARDKTSQFHACGTFHDKLIRTGDQLQFAEHNIVLDAETLPANIADLF